MYYLCDIINLKQYKMKMTRENVIEKLIEDRIDTVQYMIDNGDYTYIDSVFRDGVGSLNDLCNEDLTQEYKDTFGDTISIVDNVYMCDSCGGGFTRDEMDFDVNDQDLCKDCSTISFNDAPYGN